MKGLNVSKISQLKAYYTQHKFDTMCISEKYLDSGFPDDGSKFNLSRYNLW